MRTNFALEKDENNEFKCGSAFVYTHTILIEYTDYTGENVYKSKFNFEININIDVNNEPHFFCVVLVIHWLRTKRIHDYVWMLSIMNIGK